MPRIGCIVTPRPRPAYSFWKTGLALRVWSDFERACMYVVVVILHWLIIQSSMIPRFCNPTWDEEDH